MKKQLYFWKLSTLGSFQRESDHLSWLGSKCPCPTPERPLRPKQDRDLPEVLQGVSGSLGPEPGLPSLGPVLFLYNKLQVARWDEREGTCRLCYDPRPTDCSEDEGFLDHSQLCRLLSQILIQEKLSTHTTGKLVSKSLCKLDANI